MRRLLLSPGTALPVVVAALGLLPAAARGQEGACGYTVGHNAQTFARGTPSEATYMGGGVVFNCPDGRLIKADSVVMLANGDQRLLVGHAYYSDKEKTLTADQINYLGNQHRMFAQFGGTNPTVTLVDKVNGAVIRGQFMDYAPAQGTQPSHTTIYSGPGATRPHAVLRGKSQKTPPAPADTSRPAPADTTRPAAADTTRPAAADTTRPAVADSARRAPADSARRAPADSARRAPADTARPAPKDSVRPAVQPAPPQPADTMPTLVDADRMEITGQKAFHAIGNVVLTRADMKGTANDAVYDPDAEHLKLSGSAHVTGDQFTLSAGTIDGTLSGNEFRDVVATFQAVLDSKDLHVKSPQMTVGFERGQVQRLVALSAERAKRTATDGKAMAEAFAKDFHLIADSIDARAPNQKIDQVVAVGRAYGERQNDSIKVKMPEIAAKDWLKGDTITGFFTDAPPKAKPEKNGNGKNGRGGKAAARSTPKLAGKPVGGAPDGAAPADSVERVLERIVAVGDGSTPASSMYRVTDEKKPEAAPAISYLLAKRIVVAFRDGEVHEVSADGQIRGIHLMPEEKPAKGKNDKDTKATPAKKLAARPAPGSRP